MKKLFQLGLAALSLAAVTPLAKAWTYSNEDALLIFRKSGGVTNVEFNLGNVSQFLGHSSGYLTVVTNWDVGLVNQSYGGVTNNVRFAVVATTSKDIVAKKAWLSDIEAGAPANRTPSQWQNIWSKIDAVGKNPVSASPNSFVTPATAQAAYDYINSSGGLTPGTIPTLGGASSFVVEQTIPGGLSFWEIGTNTPAVSIGQFALNAHGVLYFAVGSVPAPTIITQPAAITVEQGADATFSVVATNQLSYQWQKDGTNLVGATGSSLTVSNAQAVHAGSYTVIVSSVSDATSPTTSAGAALTVIPDSTPPTVVIKTPGANAKVKGTNNVNAVTVLGTAADNKLVKTVKYSFNGGAFSNATGTASWSVTGLPFVPGTNTLIVKSIDRAGNESAPVSRSFIYTAFSTLTVLTEGGGAVTPNLNGVNVAVDKSYTLTAKPGPGYLFSNWVSVVSSVTNVAGTAIKLAFAAQEDQTIIGRFVTNRFTALAGNYNGLFSEAGGVTVDSAGLASVKVTAAQGKPAAFSAKFNLAGEKVSASGVFGLDGLGVNTKIVKFKASTNTLTVRLQLPFDGSDTISGTVSNEQTGWTAQLDGDRVLVTAGYANNYTIVVPGATNGPQGDSVASVIVNAVGVTAINGTLADGSAFKQKVAVSKNGQVPVFAVANQIVVNGVKIKAGAILGWLTVSNTPPAGTLYWVKNPIATDTYYPAGFSAESAVASSAYTNLAPVIGLNNGTLTLQDGNLTGALTNLLSLSALNKFTASANHGLKLTVKPATGLLKGSFKNPANGNLVTPVIGAVLQNAQTGHGFFKGTNESGSFLIQSN